MYRRLLARLSHSLPSSHPSSDSCSRLGFVRAELEGIRVDSPPPQQSLPLSVDAGGGGGGGGELVEISHPWPEWVQLMELLLKKNYLDRAALSRDIALNSSSLSMTKDSNHIRTACLNFARDRIEVIRYLSRRDIQIIVKCGCPSIDRKVVNSGKRLRAHVGIQEGDVCSSCGLRGSCDRAYVKAHQNEVGRTVDVMRILLTHGLDMITGSVENPACTSKAVKESIRKLLNEMFEFGSKELEPSDRSLASLKPSSKQNISSQHKLFSGQNALPMKQGDWICPKCNFLNFAKNIKCLRCNVEFLERLKQLNEDLENLPLKKGDWICEKCNFLNFAKNTRCLQCHEKPPKRHLNPGEWECPSCNYINFRKNMLCLKCEWKRPKATGNGEFDGTPSNSQGDCNSRPISFVRDSDTNTDKSPNQGDGSDFWSSDDQENYEDNKMSPWKRFMGIDDFPITGGRSEVSQDPLARDRWKEEMLRKSKEESNGGLSPAQGRTRKEESNIGISPAHFRSRIELDESGTDDEIAGWFRNWKS